MQVEMGTLDTFLLVHLPFSFSAHWPVLGLGAGAQRLCRCHLGNVLKCRVWTAGDPDQSGRAQGQCGGCLSALVKVTVSKQVVGRGRPGSASWCLARGSTALHSQERLC